MASWEVLGSRFESLAGMEYPVQVVGRGSVVWRSVEEPRGGRSAEELSARVGSLGGVGQEDGSVGGVVEAGWFPEEGEEGGGWLVVRVSSLVSDVSGVGYLLAGVASRLTGTGRSGSQDRVEYADYAEVVSELVSSSEEESVSGREYWRSVPGGDGASVAWPWEGEPGVEGMTPWVTWGGVGSQGAGLLRDRSSSWGVSVEDLLATAWRVVLGRLSGEGGWSLGVVLDGRRYAGLESSVGPFDRAVALGIGEVSGESWRAVAVRVSSALSEHGRWPEFFDWSSRAPGSRGFAVAFESSSALGSWSGGGVSCREVSRLGWGEPHAVKLSVSPSGAGWLLGLQHDLSRCSRAAAGRLLERLERAVAALVEAPESTVESAALLGPQERREVLSRWRGPRPEDRASGRLEERVARAAVRYPERVAVVSGSRSVSYGALWSASGRLASALRGRGVGAEDRVALSGERSIESVVGVLGILRSGAAWVSIESRLPAARVASMVASARVGLGVATDASGAAVLEAAGVEWVAPAAGGGEAPAGLRWDGSSLAYVLFTSGSTGRPKGVEIAHGAIGNRVEWMLRRFSWGEGDRVLQRTAWSFDASVWEVFVPLVSGSTMVLASSSSETDGWELLEQVRRERVTVLQAVPSLLAALIPGGALSGCPSLRRVLSGGEALAPDVASALVSGVSGEVVNLYGPTENAIDASFWCLGSESTERRVPIGEPLDGVEIVLADGGMEPVAWGSAGEVWLSGLGLARGYAGEPARTAERFVPEPWSGRPGSRAYRTGDLARARGDGALEYLGRVDTQVKVRGYRIELGEVESALRAHPGVSESVASVEEGASRRLVAHVVAREGFELTAEALASHAASRLPEYMVPSAWGLVGSLPRLASGKVDRGSLPAVGGRDRRGGSRAAPRTERERILASVWSEVLGVEEVGTRENFFELGGDSILSIQVVSRAAERGLRLMPRDLFEHQTVAALAAAVREPAAVGEPAAGAGGEAPLLPIARDFFARGLVAPHHYNQSVLLASDEALAPGVLARAVERVLARHEALRLRFVPGPAGPRQEVAEPPAAGAPGAWIEVDLSALAPGRRREALEAAAARVQGSFDLAAGGLLRVVQFVADGGGWSRLLLVAHHLVIDGVSWRLVLDELERLSGDPEAALAPAGTPFGAWARGLASWAVSAAARAEAGVWRAAAGAAVGDLPEPEANGPSRSGSVSVELSEAVTEALRVEVPSRYGVRLHEVALAALGRVLCSWAGCDRLAVELEGHGREPAVPGLDPSRTVGWLTALYPVVVEGSGRATASVRAAKEALRRVPGGGLSYGALRHLGPEPLREELSASPRPRVSFNYLGQLDAALGKGSRFRAAPESAGPWHSPLQRPRYRLTVDAQVSGGRLRAHFGHDAGLDRHETVERLASAWTREVEGLLAALRSAGRPQWTPAEFPLAGLDAEGLERLLAGAEGIEDVYPLSPLQQGLLYHALAAPGRGVYFQQLRCRLEGPLDREAFAAAWRGVVERHPVLRTRFVWEGLDRPLQVVERRVGIEIAEHDLTELPGAQREDRLEALATQDRRRGFALSEAPLMRWILARTGPAEHALIWSHHHLVLDGWSVPRLVAEVWSLYEGLVRGERPELPAVRPYRDYVAWLSRRSPEASEAFWREALAGVEGPTPLGGRAERSSGEPAHHERALTGVASAALAAGAARHQVTPNTLVQAAWGLVLARAAGEGEAVFGAVSAGRPAELEGVERMIGNFINTLPVRVEAGGAPGVGAWLAELQAHQAEAREHEATPLIEIQGWSEVPRGEPLFESLLVYENYPVERTVGGGTGEAASLRIREARFTEHTDYPLTLEVYPGEPTRLLAAYDRGRFEATAIERRLAALEAVLAELAGAAAETPVDALGRPGPAERQQVLVEWNDSAAPREPAQSVPAAFAARAAERPDAVALVAGGEHLSYAGLERRSRALAAALAARGVGPEVPVGVHLERSAELVVALLAVLRAGGAYVPLDPALPAERLARLAEDALGAAPVAVVLTRDDTPLGEIPELPGLLRIPVDHPLETPGAQDPRDLEPDLHPASLAYVLFTSGSTGRPKGVMNAHAGIANRLAWMQEAYRLGHGDRVLQKTPYTFDVSIWELFWPLIEGACLVVAAPEGHRDNLYIRRTLARERVTVLHFVPSMLHAMVDDLDADHHRSVRDVVCSGEALTRNLSRRFAARLPDSRLHNLYGPTEAAIDVSAWPVDPDEAGPVPIGRPISNLRLYVLDGSLRPAPLGGIGELAISGVGVARGYLVRPARTAGSFVPDPFSPDPGGRLYRSGDLARWRRDGTLEYLGRIDHQVKLHGVRVELGEVEAALLAHPAVRQAVAVVRPAGSAAGAPILVAYLVASEPLGAEAVRSFVRRRLPEAMVPARVVELDGLPLTPSGKVDRRALPAPSADGAGTGYRPPRSAVELAVAHLWEELFDRRPVGPDDDFFDLGGHSLLAVRLFAEIRSRFGVELPLASLPAHTTVAAQARRIAQGGAASASDSPLVLLRPGEGPGPQPRPLFCVHPGGGGTLGYVDLAYHLAPGRAVYGLQARGWQDEREPLESVEAMAEHYLRAVRTVQPTGPYALAGWSFGGLVAFEMARRLEAEGERTEPLALLDAAAPGHGDGPEPDEAELIADILEDELPLDVERLRALESLDERLAHVLDVARERDLLPEGFGLDRARRYFVLRRVHQRAARAYAGGPYGGRIVLFRAQEGLGGPDDPEREPTLGWPALAHAGVDLEVVPGRHETLVRRPYVRILAERLERELGPPGGSQQTWDQAS